MGATFTIEEKVSLSNLAAQIAQVTVLTANLANYNWSTLPGKPTTFVYTDQLYSDPSWLSISKTFVGLGNVENTALSTWAGTSNLRNAGPLTIAGGVQSSLTPFINATQTWNNAAVTFTGVYANVTDTASNAASLLVDLQIGGVSKLSIDKTGKILGNGANPYLYLDNSGGSKLGYGTGILTNGGSSLTWSAGGTEVQRVDNAGLVSVASGGGYQWSSTTASSGTKDLILLRDAAATLAQRNGTTAQGLRVYNTYTDASNYERSSMYWSGNQLYIGSEKSGTGTARTVNIGSNPSGAPDAQLNLQGTTIRLYTTTSYLGLDSSSNPFPGVTTGTLGNSGSPWNGIYLSKTITAAGTTGAQTINKSSGSVNFAAAATSLVVTNSLVTTNSVIVATVGTNDTTMKTVSVTAAAGSFTLTANAAATAETRVNFVVLS